MKASTNVFLALRHVGKSDDSETHVFQGSFAEVIRDLAQHLAPRYMATRFDLCLARSEEEARGGIRSRNRTASAMMGEIDLSQLENLMAGGAAE